MWRKKPKARKCQIHHNIFILPRGYLYKSKSSSPNITQIVIWLHLSFAQGRVFLGLSIPVSLSIYRFLNILTTLDPFSDKPTQVQAKLLSCENNSYLGEGGVGLDNRNNTIKRNLHNVDLDASFITWLPSKLNYKKCRV